MKPTSYILSCFFCLAAAASLTGCVYDNPVDESAVSDGEQMQTMLLEISVDNLNGGSRANPTGGPDGDGSFPSSDNENNISNLTFFFYEAEKGIAAPNSTPILHAAYVEDEIGKQANRYLAIVRVPIKADVRNSHHVIVTANMGDLSNLTRLGDVRDYVRDGQSWTVANYPAGCKDFAMSSAADAQIVSKGGTISIRGKSWKYNLSGSVSIQRLAARVDLYYRNSQYDAARKAVKYAVDNSSAPTANVYITNLKLFNVPVKSSYLIRRTSYLENLSMWTYLGSETETDGVATNYVIDPNTHRKTYKPNLTETDPWFGESAASEMLTSYPVIFSSGNHTDVGTLSANSYTMATDKYNNNRSFTIGYTEENTQTKESMLGSFVTGFVAKAVYEPTTVYRSYDATTDTFTEDAAYAYGKTFWVVDRMSSVAFDRDRRFFSNSAAATNYARSLESKGNIAEVRRYPNAVCYYTVWIRHSNKEEGYNQIHEYCPMQYSVVRNNLYLVSLTVHGPGTITPRIEEPETIRPMFWVHKWILQVHGEIAV